VLGVHRAENSVPVSDEVAFQTAVSGQASAYLAAMGVSGELLALMSDVPHDGIRILAPQEAARMNLVTTTQD
jgi:hypothetical protein